MNNLVKINFNGYDLNNEIKYFNEQEINELQTKRTNQILSPQQLAEKIKSKSKQVQCLNPEADNKVFVYFSKEGEETDTPVHFYDKNGKLIMTFPFNGEVETSRGKNGPISRVKYVNDYITRAGHSPMIVAPLKQFKMTATEKGNIFINVVRKGDKNNPGINCTESMQFDYDGEKFHFAMPSFQAKEYPDAEVAKTVEEYYKKNKDDGLVFAGALCGGEKFLEYGKKHSRVY